MKKNIPLTLLLLFCGTFAMSQQLIQFSQYFNTAQVFNPATTGINDYLSINSGYRSQWSGFDGAPNTYFITASGKINPPDPGQSYRANSLRISDPSIYRSIPVRTARHAVGGYLIADSYGPVSQYYGYASYAFHIPLRNQVKLSLGASAGISTINYKNGLEVRTPGDDTFNGFLSDEAARAKLNANIGAFLYSPKFYIGYAATQLLQQPVTFETRDGEGKQNIGHVAMAGYNFDLNSYFTLSPGVLMRYVEPMPLALDMTLRLSYNDTFWGGFSYRNKDAVIGMLGFNIKKQVNISYSFDYNTSDIGSYNSGTHELILGLTLGNKKGLTPYF